MESKLASLWILLISIFLTIRPSIHPGLRRPSIHPSGQQQTICLSSRKKWQHIHIFFRVRGCGGFLMQCTHPRACVTGRGRAGLCTVYYLSYVKTNYLLTAGEILFITQDALRQCPCPCSALTVHGNM